MDVLASTRLVGYSLLIIRKLHRPMLIQQCGRHRKLPVSRAPFNCLIGSADVGRSREWIVVSEPLLLHRIVRHMEVHGTEVSPQFPSC